MRASNYVVGPHSVFLYFHIPFVSINTCPFAEVEERLETYCVFDFLMLDYKHSIMNDWSFP
jgi:hypothetical protein